jgi:hypothetical protein
MANRKIPRSIYQIAAAADFAAIDATLLAPRQPQLVHFVKGQTQSEGREFQFHEIRGLLGHCTMWLTAKLPASNQSKSSRATATAGQQSRFPKTSLSCIRQGNSQF